MKMSLIQREAVYLKARLPGHVFDAPCTSHDFNCALGGAVFIDNCNAHGGVLTVTDPPFQENSTNGFGGAMDWVGGSDCDTEIARSRGSRPRRRTPAAQA
jgi:hypothetical protein